MTAGRRWCRIPIGRAQLNLTRRSPAGNTSCDDPCLSSSTGRRPWRPLEEWRGDVSNFEPARGTSAARFSERLSSLSALVRVDTLYVAEGRVCRQGRYVPLQALQQDSQLRRALSAERHLERPVGRHGQVDRRLLSIASEAASSAPPQRSRRPTGPRVGSVHILQTVLEYAGAVSPSPQ